MSGNIMNIVVLDGFALNPGDLSWDALHQLGKCTVYERTAPGETLSRAGDAEVALTNKTVLSAELLAALPKLRYIGVLATGYNVVDVVAARAHGITVTNVPGYSTRSVAQHAIALLLELSNHVGFHAAETPAKWCTVPDYSYWDKPLLELDGLTMGIVGYGTIGKCTGELARAFGMKVVANSRKRFEETADARWLPLDELLAASDVVSLHCPLTDETRSLINERSLALMKPTAFLINTSRGPLVDESALAAALHAGKIAGAGLDVLSSEPPQRDNPLLTAPNCVITPHQAWASGASRTRLIAAAAENVRAFLAGRPVNVVN
jgi:glycerate dehydrogenase